MTQPPRLVPDLHTPTIQNPATLIRLAYEGGDVGSRIRAAMDQVERGTATPDMAMDLSLLFQLVGQRNRAMECLSVALAEARQFRVAAHRPPRLRLLAFVTHGDLMTNAPFELMLEGGDVEVFKLYLAADGPLPDAVPDHDVALIAITEADETRDVLYRLHALTLHWPRPVLNRAMPIMELARDRLFRLLANDPAVAIPPSARVPRDGVAAIAANASALQAALPGSDFPLIVRPIGSHAGVGLELIDTAASLSAYLEAQPAAEFAVSPFVDYRSKDDGRFRKYRVALIGGVAHLCHLAIGDHWMVHYLNAGMAESADKRAEEAAAMHGFRTGFAARHAAALAEINQRIGLDYVVVDCGELPDGRLLVFEAGTAMIVHALDSVELYPYKKPHMDQVFAAFRTLLDRAAPLVAPDLSDGG